MKKFLLTIFCFILFSSGSAQSKKNNLQVRDGEGLRIGTTVTNKRYCVDGLIVPENGTISEDSVLIWKAKIAKSENERTVKSRANIVFTEQDIYRANGINNILLDHPFLQRGR